MRAVAAVVILVMLTWIGVSAASQGSLHGVVRDGQGRLVAGAVVQVEGADGVRLATTTSGPDGTWRIDLGGRRGVAIEVKADGFRPVRVDLPTPGDRAAAVVVGLEVAQVREQVVVTAVPESAPLEVVTDPRHPRQPMPAHDGADYLETIPGFTSVRKGGSGADPVFRGMGGSRLAILADGATILGGCSSRMDAPTAYVFPESYDRITVIKGPHTVKYGAAASAGTVLFERTPDQFVTRAWKANAGVTTGAWGRHDEVADLRVGSPRLYLRWAGSRSAMGNYRDGDGTLVHSEYMRWSQDTAIGWTPDDATRVEVAGSFSDGQAAYADRSVDGSKFRRTGLGVTVNRERPGSRLNRLQFAWSRNGVDHIMDNYTLRTFTPSAMSSSPSAMNPDRTTVGGRAAAAWTSPRATVDLGLDWQTNEHRQRTSMRDDVVPVASLPRVADARFASTGLFAEFDVRPHLRTRVTGGARVDRARGTDLRQSIALSMMESAANPSANARRLDVLGSGFGRVERTLAAAPVTIYAGVGHVARMPDYWELMTKESATSLSAFGTRPETTTQVDAGVQVKRPRTSLYVSTYASRVADFILVESGVAKAAGMGTRQATIARNVRASTAGLETGLTHRVGQAWTFDGAVAYVRGTNLTDRRPLAQMPPLDGRLSAQYDRGRWSAAGLVRLVAAQRRVAVNQGTIVGQDFRETPGFSVVSVNAGWRLTSMLSVTGGVDNVFDTAYAEHISRQGAMIPGFAMQTAQIREPGRAAWVRLNVVRAR